MKSFIHNIFMVATLMFAIQNASATSTQEQAINLESQQTDKTAGQYQELIEQYKQHLSSVPQEIRDEIKKFRMEIVKLQKQKRDLYKKLSIEAQEYLKIEEKFRQKLPAVDDKVDLTRQAPVQSEQSNKSF